MDPEVRDFYDKYNPFIIPSLLDEIVLFKKMNGSTIKHKAHYFNKIIMDVLIDMQFREIKNENILDICYMEELGVIYIKYVQYGNIQVIHSWLNGSEKLDLEN